MKLTNFVLAYQLNLLLMSKTSQPFVFFQIWTSLARQLSFQKALKYAFHTHHSISSDQFNYAKHKMVSYEGFKHEQNCK